MYDRISVSSIHGYSIIFEYASIKQRRNFTSPHAKENSRMNRNDVKQVTTKSKQMSGRHSE